MRGQKPWAACLARSSVAELSLSGVLSGLVQGILHKSQFPHPEKAGTTGVGLESRALMQRGLRACFGTSVA